MILWLVRVSVDRFLENSRLQHTYLFSLSITTRLAVFVGYR